MMLARAQRLACFALLFACGCPALQAASYDGPIIDVHLHTEPPGNDLGAPNPASGAPAVRNAAELRDKTLELARRHNIVKVVLSGWPGTLDDWIAADPTRIIAAPMVLKSAGPPAMSVAELRKALLDRPGSVMGEITSQYVGRRPDDPVLEPYFRLAEELDVPVMIHTGTSFPGTAYSGYPDFRVALGNPMLLEEVLVKHPKLRVWIAHGGEPWSQETFALMQQYPQVYMDVSTINWINGRAGLPGFHAFLQRMIQRSMGQRILFGTDQMGWPDAISLAIEAVDSAPFLTAEQKRDIFHDNAVRFFRLTAP